MAYAISYAYLCTLPDYSDLTVGNSHLRNMYSCFYNYVITKPCICAEKTLQLLLIPSL